MDRRQVFAVLVLKELGVKPNVDTFTDRLIAQKMLYLSQAVGVKLGYFYGWYLHGPYCPAATKDLFSATLEPAELARLDCAWTLDQPLKRRLHPLKEAIEATRLSAEESSQLEQPLARRLELLASVHFLVDRSGLPHHATQKIVETLKRYKKSFTKDDVTNAVKALAFLRLHPFASASHRGGRYPRID